MRGVLGFLLCALFFSPALMTSESIASEPPAAAAADDDVALQGIVQQMAQSSFEEKITQVAEIASSSSAMKLSLLQWLTDNQLYLRKSDQQPFVITDFKAGASAHAPFSTEVVQLQGRRDKRQYSKIRVNNSVRAAIRSELALIHIRIGTAQQRSSAAQQLLKDHADIATNKIAQLLQQEKDPQVHEVLQLVLAMQQLESSEQAQRLQAIEALQRSLYPPVKVALLQHLKGLDPSDVRQTQEYQLTQKTLASIEQLNRLNGYAQDLYFGLSLGAVLLLAAIGLAITFGVMGVINMAHGEMIMLGAYTTYMVQQLLPDSIGVSLIVSIPAAFLVSGLVGVVMERSVIRHLYGRPLETLLATFGISLILQQAVRSIFGPLNREVATPEWMAGTFMLNPGLELTWNRLYIIIFSLLVLAMLALIVKRTLFGLQMRAVTMNRPMASSMGIKTGWVDALTFGLGSGIAGVAGVALSQLTNVGPNLGQAYIIDSFMVVVFGGVGNLWGTLVAAMSLGVANKLFEPLAGAVLAKILVLVFIILFIQKRPRGLFALKGRAVEG
ncbi:urea ABC transporter permease subunit UrtB [Bacterioplanes sanyensis]|uniref:Urea ABC transporter permease subunit UrtB n=1 Tax=Bacterioplanes sanyensis TaxID=1249553 RepID=A0A222FHH7_9GAMM|nr:urea ABC transporter permease subunit UrtB [Bacterioplanes sanyensis]ASP38092.1 urea ABC transporter permease subunit UrtB [Bacterioplanes sanyensis]